ncbi:MAG: DUF72 domain-containing protein [Planctomycetes bacterium]|nr:DUF72 domain-containing protein [Planctomycetota bacterium]MCB9890862.1 DUF72 domain-containing protein [Planctomycetota bacterium]
MARFVYGTAGWSYKDWVGTFYPEGTKSTSFLERYAQHFEGVEIDSTFYGIPRVSTTQAWHDTTPANFLFSPKMVRDVTHDRMLQDCDDLMREYLAAMAPLREKLGPIVLQFPYYRKGTGITLERFLERFLPFVASLPRQGPRFAVEVRNKPFLKPALLDPLRERGIALVLVDHEYMPAPWEYAQMESVFTADFLPIRLIGDRHGIECITKTWEKTVVDRRSRVRAWADLIQRALGENVEVNAFANNHYGGHGPDTANQLAAFVERGPEP